VRHGFRHEIATAYTLRVVNVAAEPKFHGADGYGLTARVRPARALPRAARWNFVRR
jgi:hypothetical protein